MPDYRIRVGSHTDQGRRSNNEDRFVARSNFFLVADGMGGQEFGERASGMAAELIPQLVRERLAQNDDPAAAVKFALDETNRRIIDAGQQQPAGRRMGTTAVLALQHQDQLYIAGLGDSRAYLIRHGEVKQLTVDHTVAEALVRNGALTREQAEASPWKNVLYKFLGCVEMNEEAEVTPLVPEVGDRLILACDGITNFVHEPDYLEGASRFADPQQWAEELVKTALARGSKDNLTCVVVFFDSL